MDGPSLFMKTKRAQYLIIEVRPTTKEGLVMYQNYITMETALTLQLDFTIPNNHEARLISRFVDSTPTEILLEDTSHTGRPAFHPTMLLKMCLFGYSRSTFSGRKTKQMNKESITMK